MPPKVDNETKITILSYIRDSKDILFGKLSETLTAPMKNSKWDELAARARSVGAIGSGKDGKYLRCTTWQNWRKRAVEKRDNMRKTGTEGGKKWKYDAADEMIFDIIGDESPSLDGLSVPESSGTDSAEVDGDIENNAPGSSVAANIEIDEDEGTTAEETATTMTRNKPGPKRGQAQKLDEFNQLKALKIKAQLSLCEREERIKELEILRREKNLGIGPSEYTRKFYQPQNIIVEIEDTSSSSSSSSPM